MDEFWKRVASAVNADPRESNIEWHPFDPEPSGNGYRMLGWASTAGNKLWAQSSLTSDRHEMRGAHSTGSKPTRD